MEVPIAWQMFGLFIIGIAGFVLLFVIADVVFDIFADLINWVKNLFKRNK